MQTTPDAERPIPRAEEPGTAPRADETEWSLRRILVASSGSSTANGALRVAAALAGRTGAAIELVAVFRPAVLPPAGAEPRHFCERSDRRQVAELLRCVRAQRHAVLGASSALPMRLVVGNPPLALARTAKATGADLIVLGLGPQEAGERQRGDETALRLAYATDVPALVVPSDARGGIGRLVVLVEQPESGARIARMAATLAGPGVPVQSMTADASEDVVPRLLAHAESPERDEVIVLSLHGRTFEERCVSTRLVDRVLRASQTAVLLVPPARSAASTARVQPAATERREPSLWSIYQPGSVSRW